MTFSSIYLFPLTWCQSSSIRGLTAPWIILLHWLPLSVTLGILSKSISVHWMMLPNRVVFGFLIRFLGWYPFLNNCVSWWDQNSVISLSSHLLSEFFLLQLLPESIHRFFLLSTTPVGSVLIPAFQMLLFVTAPSVPRNTDSVLVSGYARMICSVNKLKMSVMQNVKQEVFELTIVLHKVCWETLNGSQCNFRYKN